MGSGKFTALKDNARDVIERKRGYCRKTQSCLADDISISRETYQKRMANPSSWKLWELWRLIEDLDFTDEEILALMGRGKI